MPCFSMTGTTITLASPPQTNLGSAHRLLSWQKMHSSTACASCAMSTAEESNHSTAGMLYPHHTNGHTSLSKAVGRIVPY